MATASSTSDQTNESGFMGIHHVGLSVNNLETSIAFYSSATDLGLRPDLAIADQKAEKASGFEQPCLARATLQAPNTYLQLSQFEPASTESNGPVPVNGPGVTHVCYQSLRSDDVFSRFIRQGATSVTRGNQPVNLLGQGVHYAYARDQDGIMFEVEHLDQSPFESSTWFAHVALVSHDIDRLTHFYQSLLGTPPARRSDNIAGPTFDQVADYDDVRIRAAWFELGNMILEFWQFINPPTPAANEPRAYENIGYNKIAFEVRDISAEYRRLSELGISFLSAPIQSNDSIEVFARDPDGNLFSLIEFAANSPLSVVNLKQKTW